MKKEFPDIVLALDSDTMLSDRNITTGIIKEQKITEKFIQIIVSEHGDTITIKRETKENLRTFWNVSVVSDYNFKEYIEKYSITFTEFRVAQIHDRQSLSTLFI